MMVPPLRAGLSQADGHYSPLPDLEGRRGILFYPEAYQSLKKSAQFQNCPEWRSVSHHSLQWEGKLQVLEDYE